MVLGLAVGLVAGVVSGLLRVQWGGGFLDTWGNSIGTWLVVPFAAGTLARSWRGAAGAGVLASTVQMAVFYVVTWTADGMAFWFAAAAGAGVTFGVLGRGAARRAWRARRSRGAG